MITRKTLPSSGGDSISRRPSIARNNRSAMQMLDVRLPTTDGRTVEMNRYTQPNQEQKLLLSELKLTLPPQAPPRIHSN